MPTLGGICNAKVPCKLTLILASLAEVWQVYPLRSLALTKGTQLSLFEKEEYPFHKVCGEYISLESYDFLVRLGLPLHEWNLPVIKKLLVSDRKGKAYNFDLDLGGFGISRYKIDDALYQTALKKGVLVYTNTKVNDIVFEDDVHLIQTNKGEATVRIAVAAYGKRSNLDVRWKRDFVERKPNKLNNYIGVKYHVRLDQPKDEIALHNFKNGYCGFSAIEEDKYCLCYLTNANNLSTNNNSIREMQEQVLFTNPLLRKIFTMAEFLNTIPFTISQVSFEKKTRAEKHVLMLGDAAGMITPLCGNGMSMAMHSASLAFDQINLFLQEKISRNDMEKNYLNHWNKNFSSRLATGRAVQRFMGNNSTSMFLKLMHMLPLVSKQVIRLTHGNAF